MPYFISDSMMPDPCGRGFRPAGSDVEGANWVYLDGGKSVVWLPSSSIGRSLSLVAEDKQEVLSRSSRTAFDAVTQDREAKPVSFADALADMFMVPPVGRWNTLRPSKSRKQFEIYLGPGAPGKNILWSTPATVSHASVSWVDTFNRADSNLNGSTSSDSNFAWVEVQGTEWEVLSNQAQCVDIADGTFNVACLDRDMDTDDNYAQYEIATYSRLTNTYLTHGIALRGTAFGAGDDGYGAEWGYSDVNVLFNRIYNYETDANLATGITADPSSGKFRFECDGSTLQARWNDVITMSLTNTAFTGLKRSGITCFSTGVVTPNDLAIDNFITGDLLGTATKRATRSLWPLLFPA